MSMNILISRPDRIGDVVLSTPIPREIKRNFPDAKVSMLLRRYTGDIFRHNPYVDNIIIIEELLKDGFWPGVKKLRDHSFSHAFMLLPNKQINRLLFFAGIRTRIGSGHKFYQFITNCKSVQRYKYNPLRHEADYCMDMARKIGVEPESLSAEIFLSDEEKKRVAEIRKEMLNGGNKLTGIHSTSGKSAPNWKPAVYKNLIQTLRENRDNTIVVTDNDVPDELADLEGVAYPNVGKNLRESILNFAALDMLISASTGPMHIAAGLKVKTVALFCPMTACSPKLWGPVGNGGKTIIPADEFCGTRCPGDPHICDFEGEEGISIDTVIKKTGEY